jgi:sodium/potassium/calcium exchanger 3
VNGTRRDDVVAEAGNETENENEDNENNENDEEEEEEEEEDEDDDEGPYTPFDPPCKRSYIWAGLGSYFKATEWMP